MKLVCDALQRYRRKEDEDDAVAFGGVDETVASVMKGRMEVVGSNLFVDHNIEKKPNIAMVDEEGDNGVNILPRLRGQQRKT